MYSSNVPGLRFAIYFEPEGETLIRLKGLNYRLYSRIINAISKVDEKLATEVHELGTKPFTFSRLMPIDKEIRRNRSLRVTRKNGEPYLRFSVPFVMYFGSMVEKVTNAFINGLIDAPPPFNARVIKIMPKVIPSKSSGILKTLSPIYIPKSDPSDKIFWNRIVELLKTRIKLFRNVTRFPSEDPIFRPIVNVNRGRVPRREVVQVMYEPNKKFSLEARSMRIYYSGPELYLRAALLGGLGYRTHYGLGYVNLISK